MNRSIPIDNALEFVNITELSPLVSHCEIKVCWVDNTPNRNKTVITKATAAEMAKTLPGCPIVGLYREDTEDFSGHDRELVITDDGDIKFKDITKPYGFVDINARVWFQKFQDADGEVREYLCTEGYIWTGAYPESKRIIEKGNNQSMELSEESVQGFWANSENPSSRFFIINEALIEKLCILGENVEPCFEGAQIKKEFSLTTEFEEFKSMMFSLVNEIKETLKGGTVDMQDNDIILDTPAVEEPVTEPVVEEPVIEEPIADPVVEEPTPEEPAEPQPEAPAPAVEPETPAAPAYSLEEIPEYVALRADYTALNERMEALNAEIATLREFKLIKERDEKQSMINSFYMLSDEQKKDVIENIDNYSLNDIEAKLAVICVRNKVNFSLDEETPKTEEPTLLFNLEQAAATDEAPDWVKAVREVAASNM